MRSATENNRTSPGISAPNSWIAPADPLGVGDDRDALERPEMATADRRVRENRPGIVALETIAQLEQQLRLSTAGRRALDCRCEHGPVVVAGHGAGTAQRNHVVAKPIDGLEHRCLPCSRDRRSHMFWAAERPSTRGVTTQPPNSCEGGMGVGAATLNMTLPMPPLRQQ